MAIAYRSWRQWAKAESLYRVALFRSVGEGVFLTAYQNIPVPLFAQGKLAQAESLTALGRRRNPGADGLVMNARRVLYHRGQLGAFERSLDSIRSAGGPGRGITVTSATARVAVLRGRLADAERRWVELAALYSESNLRYFELTDSIHSAHFDVWFRSKPRRAAVRLDAALALYPLKNLAPVDRPYTNLAIVYALAGRPDRARAILVQLTSSGDSVLLRRRQPEIHSALAEIALAEQRPREAIVEFRRADLKLGLPAHENPLQVLANLGRAFDQANERDSALVLFEQYLQTPYWYRLGGGGSEGGPNSVYDPPDAIFRAAITRRLGELYEAKGDPVKAARYYREFTELWKGADPDLQPVVAEVRRRLTRLTDREPVRQP